MKKIHALAIAAMAGTLFSSCNEKAQTASYNEGINIIPAPQSLVQTDGTFSLKKNNTISVSNEEVKKVGDFFASKMSRSTGYTFSVEQSAQNADISLSLNSNLDINKEGYILSVTPSKVSIEAKTPQGLFYGMQSFFQLLPAEIESQNTTKNIAWNAACVEIKDEPRFGYRGIMLDVCRHFLTVEDIKKQLDVLALFKINTFHWHLTEDQAWRIEIKKYPKLTEIGSKRTEGEGFIHEGFYTQEEIKDVVAYASERFITVIPELEIPGHELAAISAYPELSCEGKDITPRIIWGVEDIVMCPGKETMFTFLEDVINEMVPLFPGEHFHIGGDECPKKSWEKCPACQARIKAEGLKAENGHSAEEKLQSYVINRMEKVLAKHGKKIIGWDEILEGGLAPSATVMSWRGETGGIAAASMGHYVIMTPGSNGMYLDQYQGDSKIEPVSIGGYTTLEKTYSYNPVPDTLVAQNKAHYIKGVQCNIWAEYMYNVSINEYRIYPRILALSEIAWSNLDRKDFSDFSRRITNAYVRLDEHNINYHIPQPEQVNGSCNFVAFTDTATLEFKTSRPIKVVYTLDGTTPNASSKEYTDPIKISETTTLNICSILPSGKTSPVREITVEKQQLSPAATVENPTSGLTMKVIDGYYLNASEFDENMEGNISDIKTLRELRSVVHTDEQMRDVNQYGATANGYVNIPDDGVYYFTSNNDQVWIDGKLLIDNSNEVKRFSRADKSVALSKGLHPIKVIFLGHIIGGWPSNWDDASVSIRKEGEKSFKTFTAEDFFK
ncbi:MAG: family 20 glycosylhydrolase [Bacteroidales bacterium]|nr:family 20 glycosylhydrolase [Bacteroidales bacterium]